MEKDFSSFAKNLVEGFEGKGTKTSLEHVARLLSGENGKKVLASLLSDGGESVRKAAEAAKSGDTGGIYNIISSISQTPEGKELLRELSRDIKK